MIVLYICFHTFSLISQLSIFHDIIAFSYCRHCSITSFWNISKFLINIILSSMSSSWFNVAINKSLFQLSINTTCSSLLYSISSSVVIWPIEIFSHSTCSSKEIWKLSLKQLSPGFSRTVLDRTRHFKRRSALPTFVPYLRLIRFQGAFLFFISFEGNKN